MITQTTNNSRTFSTELQPTRLVAAPFLAAWLGLDQAYLKLELDNPTGTFKDKVTVKLFDYFAQHSVTKYTHCSSGNTARSLVWGVSEYTKPFQLELIVAEDQLPYHCFADHPNVRITLLEGASYQEAKDYTDWYTKTILHQQAYMSFHSEVRQEGNAWQYREALAQSTEKKFQPTHICQPVSDGSGIYGAYRATKQAQDEGKLEVMPKLCGFQTIEANPIVRGFKAGQSEYNDTFSVTESRGTSAAYYLKRMTAKDSYASVYKAVAETGGFMEDVSNEQIIEAKEILEKTEGIDAGYTACVAIAGFKKYLENGGDKTARPLFMITGKDHGVCDPITVHKRIPEAEWRSHIAEL